MMDELDLDSFIATIEQTAPEEPVASKLTCNECGAKLEEEEDGNLACPICYVQATNILQYDETELHHDEQGRPVYGQRVALVDTRAKHRTDYGWAWSTDEAIAHILSRQLNALEDANLVPDLFRPAITNMWLKYWIETIAPHIREEYCENEMVQISSKDALKLRDIEVLLKVKDKIMVPLRRTSDLHNPKPVYQMIGTEFTRASPDLLIEDEDEPRYDEEQLTDDDNRSSGSSVSFDVGPMERVPDQLVREFNRLMANESSQPQGTQMRQEELQIESQHISVEKENEDIVPAEDAHQLLAKSVGRTRNLSKESIKILTLNRTLAFIEATSRSLPQDDPLFAADIIRACNQHLIPFYNSSKCLPEGMKLNSRDRLMFHRTTLPTPVQLTRAASLLINNIYKDQLPKSMPIPDLNTILKRFVTDMNLPLQLAGIIQDKVSFLHFPWTTPRIFIASVHRRLPQYDRWAFAVLVYHLKSLFNLGEKFLNIQKQSALEASQSNPGEKFFIMSDWIMQVSSRLDLILRHDPYALYHPLGRVDKLEISAQLARYIGYQIDARASSDIRARPGELYSDTNYRNELADVLRREIKPPTNVRQAMPRSDEYEPDTNIKYPLTGAFERTESIWSDKLDKNLRDLVYRDFSEYQMITLSNLPRWSVYDNQVSLTNKTLHISTSWPEAYRVLLNVGAFLCFCRPVELVNEVRLVEECLQPHTRVIRRSSRLSQPQKGPVRSYVAS